MLDTARPLDQPSCRICGSAAIAIAGNVGHLADVDWTVYDCAACGCRFTKHDDAVYDGLHTSGSIPHYKEYRELIGVCKRAFDRRDGGAIRRVLSEWTKYRFIIQEIESAPAGVRLLEIGCSRGYLTSYFLLNGREVVGVDISPDAVESARAAFGPHFFLPDSPEVQANAPYDIIYHVGLIGCVADPVGLTRTLLGLLKPGGRLLFNAPNLAACRLAGQLWLNSAPPPDLVTIYQQGFWRRQFAEEADVREGLELLGVRRSIVPMSKRLGARWPWLERAIRKVPIGLLTRVFTERFPAEYGLFVKMRRKTCPAR